MTAIDAGTVAQEAAVPEAGRGVLAVLGSWRRQILLFAGFAAMVAFFSLEQSQTFPTVDNFKTILEGLVVLGFIAMAATVVLVLGEFDLAIPAAAALAAAVIALLTTQTSLSGSVVIAAAIGIGAATLVGATSGVAVAYGNAPSFVVTLAVSSLAGGAELFTQEKIDSGTQINRFLLPEGIRKITDTELLGVRLQVFLLLAAAVCVTVLLSRTVFGRQAHAIGGNESAARLSGVAVRRVKISGYVLGGVLAGIAGLVLVSQQGYFTNSGPPFLLKAYAAAFFGAAAFGRSGFSVPATLLGVLFLETLSNGLRLMGEPLWVTSVVTGGLLLVTVLITRVRA